MTRVGPGEKKSINPELWQACAGPLVDLPPAGTLVVYFPQGHSEQVRVVWLTCGGISVSLNLQPFVCIDVMGLHSMPLFAPWLSHACAGGGG